MKTFERLVLKYILRIIYYVSYIIPVKSSAAFRRIIRSRISRLPHRDWWRLYWRMKKPTLSQHLTGWEPNVSRSKQPSVKMVTHLPLLCRKMDKSWWHLTLRSIILLWRAHSPFITLAMLEKMR